MPGLYKNEEEALVGIKEASVSLEENLRTLAHRITNGIEQSGMGAYVVGPAMKNGDEEGMIATVWTFDESVAQVIADGLGWTYKEAAVGPHRNSAVIASTKTEYEAMLRGEKDGE